MRIFAGGKQPPDNTRPLQENDMSKCAALFKKHASLARAISRRMQAECRDTAGSETSFSHYLAAHLAAQLIAGTYTA
ncbi:hypothetical protein WM32_08940 [Burkholderia ubonensis]|nr:hypothetical protein WM32_08940 [Burkholderia ubonensis]